MPLIAARSLKVTALLEPGAVAALPPPRDGERRYRLIVEAEGRRFLADLSVKSVRCAIAAVGEHGEARVVVLQGKLAGDAIAEAGIAAQLKAPKPATVESAVGPT